MVKYVQTNMKMMKHYVTIDRLSGNTISLDPGHSFSANHKSSFRLNPTYHDALNNLGNLLKVSYGLLSYRQRGQKH